MAKPVKQNRMEIILFTAEGVVHRASAVADEHSPVGAFRMEVGAALDFLEGVTGDLLKDE